MKLIHLVFQYQYTEPLERLLAECGVDRMVRHGRVTGEDSNGRHEGSKVYPGNLAVIQALVRDEQVQGIFEKLRAFRQEKPAHAHVQAAVLSVEDVL